MSDQAASAVHPPPVHGELERLRGVLHALCRASCLDEVLRVAAHAVRTLVKADGASVVLRDEGRCHYAEEDAVSPLWKGRRFPMSACISGWCMLNNQCAVIPDIFADLRIPVDAYRPTFVRSLVMVPLGAPEPMAALGAYWAEQRTATDEEVHMLQAISDATALALSRLDGQHPPPPAPLKARPGRGQDRRPAPGGQGRRRRDLRGGLRVYGAALVCVAAATLVRLGLGAAAGPGLLPFATYVPAILAALLIGGVGPAVLAAALGALIGSWTFLARTPDLSAPLLFADLALYAGCAGLSIAIVQRHQAAIGRIARDDAAHLTMAREQGHRLRNGAAVAVAIVRRSLSDAPDKAETLGRRIFAALADLDPQAPERPVALGALILDQLRAFDPERFDIRGDTSRFIPGAQQSLIGLAIHELATNALKYGALSTSGRVAIDGRLDRDVLTLSWTESGGPPVEPPARRGYGSVLLRRLIEAQRGDMRTEFRPEGLFAEFSLPLDGARAA